MKRLRFYPILGAMALVLFAFFFEGGDFAALVGMSAGIIVVALAFFLPLSQFSPAEMAAAFRAAQGKAEPDSATIKKGIVYFQLLRKSIIEGTILASMLGAILILTHLNADAKQIGQSIAVGVLALFYAMSCVVFVTNPYESALRKRLIMKEESGVEVSL